ncbi:uncharacterized protein ATNIH1004_010577 [Aspergillus tanneri]|uniref:Uncharacterized protein n=1 Tax=Aspergillus tanneri TaxID=1220188 RepID=A0A5M9MFQ2_9EURO|nr:uncharacterized protein ATNIH1004_010577 [Aspergillus tanneri]KAA8643803.1 hypothetical protein ATNIH1004_010577 [Aspergillus tanneri]
MLAFLLVIKGARGGLGPNAYNTSHTASSTNLTDCSLINEYAFDGSPAMKVIPETSEQTTTPSSQLYRRLQLTHEATLVSVYRRRLHELAYKTWQGERVLDLLHRAHSSVLIQMQTGRIALASYLGTFGAIDTTACPCGYGTQSVQYVLLLCNRHADLQLRTL